MINSNKIRLIIIGAGKMGFAHAAAFSKLAMVEIVSVSSRSNESAELLAKRFNIASHNSDWREEIKKTQPNAAVICVPHLLTESIATEVIERGLHVLIEKPVALKSENVKKMASLAKSKNLVSMVAMNRRFYSTVLEGILTANFYGKILGLTVIAPDPVKGFRAEAKYDSIVYDQWLLMNTVHIIDLMRLIGGDVCSVSTVRINEGDDSSRAALLKFVSGIPGTFTSMNSMGGMNKWELIIHGEGVEIRLQPLERGVINYANGVSAPLTVKVKGEIKSGLLEQAANFIEAVNLGKVVYPGSDLDDHAKTMELIESMQ